jgi:hypothetical protein
MMTVPRLVWTYFTATEWSRWFSAAGLIIVAGALAFPDKVVTSRYLPAVCFAGGALFFLGSAFMPLLFARLFRSHQLAFLPFGRLKLIISALLTNVLTCIPIPVMSMLVALESFSEFALRAKVVNTQTYRGYLTTHFFAQMSLTAFFWTTWMYIVLWSITSSRNALGVLRTLLIIVALIAIPPRYISISSQMPLTGLLAMIALSWTLFIGAVVLLPRLKHSTIHTRGLALHERWRSQPKAGDPLQLILGIANPWIIAVSVVLCIALDTLFIPLQGPWLFFLAILGLVAGAIAGKAASRSRWLWLRLPCSRAELFNKVERLLWRHVLPSLSIILICLTALGAYSDRTAWIVYGAPLICLAATASLYLGLMQTTELRLLDATIAVTLTLLVMGIAVYAAVSAELDVVVGLEFVLCVGAVILRFIARQRWNDLDWCMTPRRNA